MAPKKDDYHELLDQKRFLGEVEQGIRFANREIIQKVIPHLTKEAILSFAVVVGRLRAEYLEAAFRLGSHDNGGMPEPAQIAELRTRREMFEEAREAFEALRHSIERGYVDVQDLKGEP